MTEFLVRRFVKDYKKTEDTQVRTRYGLMASIVGICCNVILFSAKLLVGMLVNSISVMADAFNNLSDAASSIIGFIGVKMAGKPADEDHPFGHGRMEYIAAFIVAFLVIQVGFSFLKTSIGKIIQPEEMTFKAVSVVILLLSVCVKLWMAFFNNTLGKRIQSTVMKATAADSLGDVITTSATIVSILVYGIWGLNIDGIIGIAVSVIVMWAGVKIAKDTLTPLIGEPIDPKLYVEITEFVESYDGIIGSHDLIVHNYGPSRSMASIHAEVPNDVDIEVSHEIIDTIEREAVRKFGIFLVIHMDPVETKDSRVLEFGNMVNNVLQEIDSRISFHDFRMVEGKSQINLIFDLVMPREYDRKKKDWLKEEVTKKVTEIDKRCCLIITAESGFGVEK
ncbi:cation diffusion facilitator family transporter [Lacrimispora sphenoides]|uniref:Cation diffusion facilitator family transporter n=1 Tax=Lacrimispora sphenoides JCM 1415 TaxID=1297793 RepID=A0ABY1CJ30_9FIRM|nr:cation diffusion facilitator family transporter [Lacrimispora sphenoides]SEU08309.1 cation diffusion facilitator family transporter [[Clostridium] sphenoides JCM 1415]SUY49336.1 cation diffusion facilitator family transporter [Lacrimispora sphenoides]